MILPVLWTSLLSLSVSGQNPDLAVVGAVTISIGVLQVISF
jgi:hypothetical protein